MNKDNSAVGQEFIQIIKDIVKQEIKQQQVLTYEVGKVTAINSGLIDVQLTGDTVSITGLLNKTGQTLSISDEVVVFLLKDLTNSYVALKFGI